MKNITAPGLVILLAYFFALAGCSGPVVSFTDKSESNTWVFVKLEVSIKEDTTGYNYYGQIKESALDKINKSDVSGLFTLKNMRFWNDSDKLEIYEDADYFGKVVFRMKDIVKVELLKKDPILIFKYEDLEENSKKLLKTLK